MAESPPDKPASFRTPRNVIDPREFTPEAMAAVVSEWLADKPAPGAPTANKLTSKKRAKPAD